MTQVRDDDASANDQADIQRIVQLLVAESGFDALDQVVIDAVIAAQDKRSDQSEQFLGFAVERAIPVTLAVEAEESVDAKMIERKMRSFILLRSASGLLELFEGGASGSVAHDFALSLNRRIIDRQVYFVTDGASMTVNRPHQRPHVLIVSDDQGLAEFLSEGLTIAGFWTSVIASALQTLEVFRLRTFDLIIVDAALDGARRRTTTRSPARRKRIGGFDRSSGHHLRRVG
ncbi:MAG: hypothetical protein R2843_06700 [Thermomicrobiales bacterium]